MNHHFRRSFIAPLLALILLVTPAGTAPSVSACPGIPGSPEFGIGARLDLNAPGFTSALSVLKSLHLDWISIEYSWADFSPQADANPNYTKLDQALSTAQSNGTAVLLSLTHPPAWAATQTGPNPDMVATLLTNLLKRYPGSLQAVELFPSPNTRGGWGAPPDPAAYLRLYHSIAAHLTASSSKLILIAGGMEVLASEPAIGDFSDTEFLKKLLLLAQNAPLPVIGLRFPNVIGMPSVPDNGKSPSVLRHYEEIRRLIKEGGYPGTLLWITYLGLPTLPDQAAQSAWLAEAYPQVRSQLYIGAAFLQGLNTCSSGRSCAEVSLLENDLTVHPFTGLLRSLLQAYITPTEIFPGRTKSNIFIKPR